METTEQENSNLRQFCCPESNQLKLTPEEEQLLAENPTQQPAVIRLVTLGTGSSLDTFCQFFRTAHNFNGQQRKALLTIRNRLEKVSVLSDLSERLSPLLDEDEKELQRLRFTHASYGKAIAAISETIVCELYAILDGIDRVLYAVFPKSKGVPEKKTQKLFSNASQGAIAGVPEPIVDALKRAHGSWFPTLCRLRTEVTHFAVGSCGRNSDGGVMYFHPTLGNQGEAFIIPDIQVRLSALRAHVSALLDIVFDELLKTVQEKSMRLPCLFCDGRLYERAATPNEAADRFGGVCCSFRWFDKPGERRCPLVHECGAYVRATGQW